MRASLYLIVFALQVTGARKVRAAPVLELGIYGLLLFLKKLQRLKMPGLPTALAKLSTLVGDGGDVRLSLQSLTFGGGGRDRLTSAEVAGIARLCGEALAEVINFSPDCCAAVAAVDDAHAQDFFLQGHHAAAAAAAADRNFSSSACRAATHLRHVRSFSGRLGFACFVNFARINGRHLTRVHLASATVFDLADILLLRKFARNLEAVEGSFHIRTEEQDRFCPPPTHRHDPAPGGAAGDDSATAAAFGLWIGSGAGPFSPELKKLLAACPMRRLRAVDVEGRLTLMAVQLFAGNAARLEQLHVANSAPASASAAAREGDQQARGALMSDEWVDGLVHAGALQSSLRRLTLRLSRVETADAGAFSEAGLVRLLDHCAERCPRVGEIVGEFTRIPDLKMAAVVDRSVAFYSSPDL